METLEIKIYGGGFPFLRKQIASFPVKVSFEPDEFVPKWVVTEDTTYHFVAKKRVIVGGMLASAPFRLSLLGIKNIVLPLFSTQLLNVNDYLDFSFPKNHVLIMAKDKCLDS